MPKSSRAILFCILGAAALGCSDEPIDAPGDPLATPALPSADVVAAPGGLRRLLGRQYKNSIVTLLGPTAGSVAAPPPDQSLDGFDSIGASELAIPESAIDALETSARAVAEAAIADPTALSAILPCAPAGPDDVACHRAFAQSFGRLAWRRPLSEAEVERLVALAQRASLEPTGYGDFLQGVAHVISALLQSPNFVYLVEVGEPLPDKEGQRRLTRYELAARMSFFLLDTTPDGPLLDVAELGALDDDAGIVWAAGELLKRPAARDAVRSFYSEVYKLRDLPEVTKSADLFPGFTTELKAAMQEETLRLVDHVIWEKNGDVRELLNAPYTFVNAELAAFYGVVGPAGADFEMVELPEWQGRAGLLGQASILSKFSHIGRSSPTRRGLFVRQMLLCQNIPPPPADVDVNIPEDTGAPQTIKQKLEKHMTDPACSGCHGLMDSPGFALEHFDAIGAYRDTDQGLAIDSNATVADLGDFSSARELGDILRDKPEVATCVIRNLIRSSLGHRETPGEEAAIDLLEVAFAESGYSFQSLLVQLVASPAFRLVGEPK